MLTTVQSINELGSFVATEAQLATARRTAMAQMQSIVGAALYAAVLADTEHEAYLGFADAENALAVMHYLPTKSISAQGLGLVKSTTLGEGTMALMTPTDIDKLQEEFLRMAETAVAPWVTAVSAPPIRVGEVDESA